MKSIKKILLLTDFSESARNAMTYGLKLFGEEAAYTLLNACQESSNDTSVLISIEDLLRDTSEKALQQEKQFIATLSTEKQLKIKTQSELGDIEEIMEQIAGKESFDFVVIGMNGNSGSWLVGKEVESLIIHSPFPVLLVPANVKMTRISSMVYAANLNDTESTIIKLLIDFVKSQAAELTFLNIDKSTLMTSDSMNMLYDISKKISYERIKFAEFVEDNIAHSIMKYADKNNINLIAVNGYKNTVSVKRLFNRIVLKELMLHSHVPILVFSKKKYSHIFSG